MDYENLYGSPLPRLSSPALDLPTRGQEVVDFAAKLGFDFLPWQEFVIMEGCRVKPPTETKPERWGTRVNGLGVARQNGKSAVLRALTLAHLFLFDAKRVVTMAQDRSLALDQFKQAVEMVEGSEYASRIKRVNRTNGQEALEIYAPSGGVARWEIVAATKSSPRGRSADFLWIDEVREITEETYKAATPMVRARPNPQIWLTSNQGDAYSTVWNSQRTLGLSGLDKSVGWWEWSAEPDTPINPDLPEFWRGVQLANPSLGHLIDPDILKQAALTDKREAFLTESFMVAVDSLESPWPAGAWAGCFEPDLTVSVGLPTWLAVDLTPDRRKGSLVGAAVRDDGTVAVAVLQEWTAENAVDELLIAGDVAGWARKYNAQAIAFDPWAAGNIANRLAAVGLPTQPVSGGYFAQACDVMLSAMTAKRVVHADQPSLSDAVNACAKKAAADGGWRVIRRASALPISAAVAAIMAVYLANQPQKTAEIIVV